MADEKRLIDANELKAIFDKRYDDAYMQSHTRPNRAYWEGYSCGVNWGRNTIADAPVVDAVEVVRCRDCQSWCKQTKTCAEFTLEILPSGGRIAFVTGPNDFCSFAKKRSGGVQDGV